MDLANITLKRIITAVGDLFLPRVCVVCGRPLLLAEKHICLRCLSDLPFTYFWQCKRNPMAEKFNAKLQKSISERDIFEDYASAAALFIYDSENSYGRITRELKYRGNLPMGILFSRLLGEKLAASEQFRGVDLVVPVPLHPRRRFQRGYNQAEIIATEVAGALGTQMDCTILSRCRYNASQTRQTMSSKLANVSGSFKAALPQNIVAGKFKHILLVDDVFTTGSTLSECHKALRTVLGSEVRISIATLGYVD